MKNFIKIFEYAKEYQSKIYLAFFLILISGIIGVIPFFLTYDIIIKFIEGSVITRNYLLIMSGGIALSLALKGYFYYKGLDASHQGAFDALMGMRIKFTEKMRKLPLGVINKKNIGSYKKNLVGDIDSIEALLAHILPECIPHILVPLFTYIIIFITDWRLGILSLGSIPFGLVPIIFMMKSGMAKMGNYYRSGEKMNSTIVEYITGMEVIKIFGRTTESYKRYKDSVNGYKKFTLEWFKESWTYMAIHAAVLPCTVILLLPIGTLLYLNGGLELSKFIFSLLLSISIGIPLVNILQFLPLIPQLNYKIKELEKTFQGHELKIGTNNLDINNYDVEFKDVTFAYEKEEVIKNVSFSAKQNTLTAIVGESGSGKSTLVKLLVHYWDVKRGEITISGININEFSIEKLMELISYVSQDTFLFNTTIMENIRIGKPNASDDEVKNAAKLAQCHDFIIDMEKGYETKVGDSGDKLSGGQKQRITIARAILKDSPIIIMDEATAFTDPENEDKIQDALNKLIVGKTVLVIAHRLSTIVDADNIILMDKGQISKQGKHGELLKNSEKYKLLWDSHLKALDWNIGAKEEGYHA